MLVTRHRDWLREHPEREAWCIKTLLAPVKGPGSVRLRWSEAESSALTWDGFCAEALPTLWAEDQDSRPRRTAIARLAMNPHYNTVAILFSAAAEHRDRLGDDFRRLQHFGLLWAGVRLELGRTQPHDDVTVPATGSRLRRRISAPRSIPGLRAVVNRWSGPQVSRRRSRRSADRALTDFMRGSLPATVPSWANLTVPEFPPEPPAHGRRRRRQDRVEFDLECVKSMFSWLPSLDEAHNDNERAEWISFWHEAVTCIVCRLGNKLKNNEKVNGTPYPWDYWVLDGTARTITEMEAHEGRRTLWEPILALGSSAHYWVETFLRYWFLHGLEQRPRRGQRSSRNGTR